MSQKRIERNADAIELYLVLYDRIHKSAAGSEVPAGKEAKGMRQYVAPVSNKAFDFFVDPGNSEAATLLAPIFRQMRREMFPYYYACGLVAGWYVPQTRGVMREEVERKESMRRDAAPKLEEERRKRLKYVKMDRSERFEKYLNEKEQKRRKQQAAEVEPEALQAEPTMPKSEAWTRVHTARYRLLRDIERKSPEMARRDAMRLCSERWGIGVPSLRNAVRFCEDDRWPDGTSAVSAAEDAAVPVNEEADHGILRRWEAKQTEEDADALATFRAACRWAAERLPEGKVLSVSAKGGRQAKSTTQGAAMDRWERQQEQRVETCRKRYEQFREIELANPDATREAAKDMWSKQYQRSIRSLEDAIRLCEKGEWPDGELAHTRDERRKRGA